MKLIANPFPLNPASLAAFSLALLFTLSTPVRAALPPDSGWQLAKHADHIKIYTRDMPNSNFEAFKAVTTLDAPLSSVMAVMATASSCMQWVHGCIEAENIRVDSFNHRFAYSVNDLPWPASDRDYVVRIDTDAHPRTGAITMRFHAVKGMKPKVSGDVRVIDSDILYRFTAVDARHTHMVWIQHTDPNGLLPSWLVNSLTVDIPFKSLKKLNKVVNLPQYQGYRIDYDQSGQITGVEKVAKPDTSAHDAASKPQ